MGRNTILVVDDSAISRMVLQKILESEYDVLEAGDGDECLRLLEEHIADIDLVVLDAWMPRLDGFAVLHEMDVRSWLKRVPVIVATADSTEDTEMKLLDLGAVDVLHKPYGVGIVLRKIESAIKRQGRMHSGPVYVTKSGDKTLLNCMGSFLYEYDWVDGSEHFDPYYRQFLAKGWGDFSIKDPSKIEGLVRKSDRPAFKAFFARDNLDEYETIDARLMAAEGAYEWFRIGSTKYQAPSGERTAVTFRNVSEERKARARLEFLATHDHLTQIFNRQAFSDHVRYLRNRYPKQSFTMLHIAIDRFVLMNQLHGTEVGDKVLKHLAVRLQESVEVDPSSVCCRLHTDRFAVFGIYDKASVRELAYRLQMALDEYPIRFKLMLSLGAYVVDDDDISVETMLDRAKEAQKAVEDNYNQHIAWYDDALRLND